MDTTHRTAFVALAVGGVLFNVYGPVHPKDSGHGNRVLDLHEMLVDPAWYPAHLVGLLAVVGFAAGAWALRGRGPTGLQRLSQIVWIISVVGVVGMVLHLGAALNADNIAGGETNAWYYVLVVDEALLSAAWTVAFAALAVVGGLTRTVGNVVTAALGLVGGGAYALALATIPFTDLFDAVFPVSGLLGLWAVVIGVWYGVLKEVPAPTATSRRRQDLARPRQL